MASFEHTPFVPTGHWSNDSTSPYVRQCFVHLGKIAGEAMTPHELTDEALTEAINGMRAQLGRINAQNKAERAAALVEVREANAAFATALAAARAALAPYIDERNTVHPSVGLATQAEALLAEAEAEHTREAAQPAFIGVTTQSLDIALEQCRAEQKRRQARQQAADEATRASLRRLGVEV
jgi:hypothetical protein